MFLARVTGSVVATQKVAAMTGHKLLTVEPYRLDDTGRDRLVSASRKHTIRQARLLRTVELREPPRCGM